MVQALDANSFHQQLKDGRINPKQKKDDEDMTSIPKPNKENLISQKDKHFEFQFYPDFNKI